jgi:hypothetical protein
VELSKPTKKKGPWTSQVVLSFDPSFLGTVSFTILFSVGSPCWWAKSEICSLNHHCGYLVGITTILDCHKIPIVTNPTFKKAFRKAFRIQISSNLDFGIKTSTIRGMILVGVFLHPWISYPRPGGPSPTWRTWQTCPAFVADLPESVVAMGKSGVLGHHICILDEEALGG